MKSYALYRLPHADHCTRIEQTAGSPQPLHACSELDGQSGFAIAPFQAGPEEPIWLIRPDRVEQMPLKRPMNRNAINGEPEDNPAQYAAEFRLFHQTLETGRFRKIVLARSATLPNHHDVQPEELFWRACAAYPRLFIALAAMPDGGYWLTATPEILLEGRGAEWRTIALAGTMQLSGDELNGEGEGIRWSAKNIQEQRYVASYIASCLEHFSLKFEEEGPRTVRAAHLVHLRSDFTFTLPDPGKTGQLLQLLHPTPAVCGLPKQETLDFILQNEHPRRQYYSGFMGPIGMDGETHLYVSLRCMHIGPDEYRLYAGGGLLKDSRLEQEWQETEAKMQTMRNLFS